MSDEIPIANPPLSAEEQSVVSRLTDTDLQIIDAAIMTNSSNRWLKVAMVVWQTEKALSDRYPGLSYIFYAQRMASTLQMMDVSNQGNLEYMRFE